VALRAFVLFLTSVVGSAGVLATPASDQKEAAKAARVAERIAALIEQLGDEHYAARQQAQSELHEIGVPALEQLQVAVYNTDPQIASSARYLLRSSFRNWTNEKDPIEVQKLLLNYGTEDYAHREGRLYRLQLLKEDRGLPAILRIARFEVTGQLRRKAAMAILRSRLAKMVDAERGTSEDIWELILAGSVDGKNDACLWLSEVAATELGTKTFSPDFWLQVVESEKKLVDDKSNETSREAFVELIKLVSEQLLRHQHKDSALQVAKKLLEIKYVERELRPAAIDKCAWFLKHEFYSLVELQCRALMGLIESPPSLTYMRAEALLKDGDPENAKKYADIAFSRNNRSEVLSHDRRNMGDILFRQMRYDWAEREYRAALTEKTIKIHEELDLIEKLYELLADGAEYGKAAEVMLPMVERFASDPTFVKEIDSDSLLRDIPREPGSAEVTFSKVFRSRFLFYRALDKINRGDLASAKPDLRESFQLFPENIDVAIVMHRHRDDEDWNNESNKIVEKTLAGFRAELTKLEKAARTNGPGEVATHRDRYATMLNNYAWLLVGTNQDLPIALEASQKSCALGPGEPGNLDTLARCHFKVGNVAEAVRTQKTVVAMVPYLREFNRSLDEFSQSVNQP
jgi:tetratricopeptide (TPR) repeat protein